MNDREEKIDICQWCYRLVGVTKRGMLQALPGI